MRKILFIVLAALMIVGLALPSCSSSTTAVKKYSIATDATWAPFEYVDTNTNQIVGFDIDLFNAIAAKENIQFQYVNVAFDPLLAGVAQGTYDAGISSITITDDRKAQMLFSDPYYAAGQIVIVGVNNNTIKGKDTLTGKVGAQLGTTGAMAVEKLSGVELKTYDEIGLAFQDLMNGQINAVVCDNPVAMGYVAKNPDKLKIAGTAFTDESYGIAVAKGNEDLLNKINAGLKAVLAEGIIKQLEDKWYKQ